MLPVKEDRKNQSTLLDTLRLMFVRGRLMYRTYLDGQRSMYLVLLISLSKWYTIHLSFTELFETIITIKNL